MATPRLGNGDTTRSPAASQLTDIPDVRVGQVRKAFLDVRRSARLWHIWMRLGVQDVRHKFRRSTVGPAWIFLNLGFLIGAIGIIYGRLLGQDLHQFIPFLTAGLIIWTYLTTTVSEGAHAFVNSEGYIKQIALPIYVYIFRAFVNVGLTTIISFSVFVIVAIAYRVPIGLGTLWAIPGAAILMIVSLLTICILAHLHARFRDIAPMASVAMQMALYVTPVMFPGELLRRRGLMWAVDFNPFFHLVEVVRRPLVAAQPAAFLSYVASAVVIAVLLAGAIGIIAYYRRRIVFVL
ncbi:MAG TPA: ABC transporter permease [Vicinamibacterales bacterium]|nr:ABC transporter permease [Vicinamibacterales bacterium]